MKRTCDFTSMITQNNASEHIKSRQYVYNPLIINGLNQQTIKFQLLEKLPGKNWFFKRKTVCFLTASL